MHDVVLKYEFRTRQKNSEVEKMCRWCISAKTETKVSLLFITITMHKSTT